MKTNVLPYCGKDHDGVAFFDSPACAEWLASNNLDLQAKERTRNQSGRGGAKAYDV